MSVQQVLTPQRVDAIFADCLFRDGEDTGKAVLVQGIVLNVGFHPGRLGSHKAEIEEMLAELPDEFKESSGGGIGRVRLLVPREMWAIMPGGMPYYIVTN